MNLKHYYTLLVRGIVLSLILSPSVVLADYVVSSFDDVDEATLYVCTQEDDDEQTILLIKLINNTTWQEVSYSGTVKAAKKKRRKYHSRYLTYKKNRGKSNARTIRYRKKWRKFKKIVRQLQQCSPGSDDSENNDDSDDSSINACATIASGIQTSSLRIIKGDECVVGDSAVVMLKIFSFEGEGTCSGTVIDDTLVLTAAHCVEGRIQSITVVTGDGNYSAVSYSAHPDYFPYAQSNIESHDVAVVKTKNSLPTNIAPLLSSSVKEGEQAIIAGYGEDENGNYEQLKAATMVVSYVDTDTIATDYDGKINKANACFGDSGGPLFVKRSGEWVVAGVTSNGDSDTCSIGDQVRYANIGYSSVLSFIEKYLD